MYPQVPGRAELVLASPLFPEITVHRASGQTITINAPGASADTYYVQSLKVNGEDSGRAWLPESFVADGGTLDYTLGATPDTGWASAAADAPPSFREGEQPYFTGTDPGRVKVQAGGNAENATVTVLTLKDTGTTVHWTASPPDGITLTATEGDLTVPAGGSGTGTLSVSAAAGTEPGFYSIPLTLTDSDGLSLPKASLAVTVGTPGSVLWNLNNKGVSADDDTPAANFDGGGYSYSAKALAAAGATPGGTVSYGGFDFTWPKVNPGDPDNIAVGGGSQVLDVSAGSADDTRLSLLGSASNGAADGTATLTYTDGTTQEVQIGFSDWTLGGGSRQPSYGNTVALSTPYRDISGGGSQSVDTDVFATAPITLDSGKQLRSVTLPGSVNGGTMHVFAVATA
jgi:hypothetical protein